MVASLINPLLSWKLKQLTFAAFCQLWAHSVMWTISVALPLCAHYSGEQRWHSTCYIASLFLCEAASSLYLSVYFLCADWIGYTIRLYLCDTEPNKCSWYQAQKQDLALLMSAVQSQHTLWSCSCKTLAMHGLSLHCVWGWEASMRESWILEWCFIKITFKCNVFCVFLCTSACRQSFPRVGELSGLNVEAWRLYLISALLPNQSWLLYLYWPWRGVQTLDLVMLTPPSILRTKQIPGHENLILTQ